MRSPETFDAYYVETRTRLLHEAYALTGDAPASRAAVRDAFVVAWHQLAQGRRPRRPRRLRPPDRPRAGPAPAHRPHLAPRQVAGPRGAQPPSTRCPSSPPRQRELLVLNGLVRALALGESPAPSASPAPTPSASSRPPSSQFSLHRDVPTTDIAAAAPRPRRARWRTIRWPRATVIRRSGAARRRTHTVIGAGLATAALVVSGSLVATGAGAEPTSLGEEKATPASPSTRPQTTAAGEEIISADCTALPRPARALRPRPRLDRDRHHRQPRRRRPARAVPARALRRPRRRHRPRPHLGGLRRPGSSGRRSARATGSARAKREVTDVRVDRRPDRRDVAQRAAGRAGLRDRLAVVRRVHRPAHPAPRAPAR